MDLLHHFLIELPEGRLDKCAVKTKNESQTYRELSHTVARLTGWMRGRELHPGDRVAVCLPKRLASVQWILATLCSGAAYVPIDFSAPVERIKKIALDAGARLIITLPEIMDGLVAIGVDPDRVIALDATQKSIEELVGSCSPSAPIAPDSDALAAILYTSGSTGVPKGVMLSHKNIHTFSKWIVDRYKLTEADRLISHAPFHFDLSTVDLYSTFIAGASVYIFDEVEKRFPSTLSKIAEAEKITAWYSVPSALMLMEEKGAMDKRDLSSLRQIFFAGEVFPLPALRKLMRRLPTTSFTNLYGPTETNVCSYYDLPCVPGEDQKSIPIGEKCPYYELLVVDENEHPLGVGEMGEIVVIGCGVMKGYWNDQTKTQSCRYLDMDDSYKTGDYGILQEDGNLTYLGRKDAQIKINGYRVELGEIESLANSHPCVKESVAVPVDQPDGKKIILVFVRNGEGDIAEEDLLSWCSRELPVYALPSKAFLLEQFQRTSTDKIDRQSVRQYVESVLNS